MKDNKKLWQGISVLALVIAIVGISVGFAALSQQLTITGQTKVAPGEWRVEFTDAQFDDNSTKATATTDTTDPSNPKPNLTGTTFSDYEIVLTKPGDKGTYTVTVENLGTIDAQLTGVTLNTGNLTYEGQATDPTAKAADEALAAQNVTYTVTWEDGSAITTGSDLNASESKNILITAEYSKDATAIPTAPVIITGRNLTLNYTSK